MNNESWFVCAFAESFKPRRMVIRRSFFMQFEWHEYKANHRGMLPRWSLRNKLKSSLNYSKDNWKSPLSLNFWIGFEEFVDSKLFLMSASFCMCALSGLTSGKSSIMNCWTSNSADAGSSVKRDSNFLKTSLNLLSWTSCSWVNDMLCSLVRI